LSGGPAVATVLIVDDRAASREVARAALDHGGHRVLEAADGRQALALVQDRHPDLIIADVLMPGMDGYEFVRELRADPVTAATPVLFYTANFAPEEAGPLAEAYGVATVLPKSASPLELLAAVDDELRRHPSPLAGQPDALLAQHLHTVNAKLLEKVDSLHESQAQLSTIAEMSPVGIAVGTAGGVATYANPRLAEIAGVAPGELLGTGWLRCLPPECRADLLAPGPGSAESSRRRGQVRLGDETRCIDAVIRRTADGDGCLTGFVAVIDDVTSVVAAEERRRAEEREREIEERRQIADRLDSLARMSGAVAHDFNNLLNVILSFGEFVREAVDSAVGSDLTDVQATAIRADLDRIGSAGRRAAHLAHQLLTFGGREVVQPTVVDVNAVVREVCRMIDGSIGRQVALRPHLDPDLRRVRIDGNQLGQVLLNLAVNARDAMPGGGELVIRTHNDGESVHIEVIDNGEGMAPDVVERAVEPFFTTRPRGQGSGLGLATAYGIVRQAGGHLVIDSSVGRGTTVHLYLPATEDRVEPAGPAPAGPGPTGRTILVADDEDGVREVAIRILDRAGYTVLAAANGEEALAVAGGYAGSIDAVLTDVVMPRMNGAELAAALRETRPATPVLYMSGYAAPLMTQQGLLEPGVTVLGKPFTRAQLLDALGATLAAAAEAPDPAHAAR
jgi:two-component system, cell cycle sensor histidine kinase and response regulator CckA